MDQSVYLSSAGNLLFVVMSQRILSCFRRSYLDVSKKIPLKKLALMMPGDLRSAWKYPCEYSSHLRPLFALPAFEKIRLGCSFQ